MISSMTAFARVHTEGSWGSLVCEIRSINHRYLEISLYLPEMLRVLEMTSREYIRNEIKRGKIECSLRYQANSQSPNATMMVNTELAKELCQASETIANFLRQPAHISPTEILRFSGVLMSKESDLSTLQAEVAKLLEETIQELVLARQREGEELKKMFLQRLDWIQQELVKVRQQLPSVITDQQARLHHRFADAKIELDSGRLEQEMVIFAQKIDVSEEIDRTETHVAEIRRVLNQGGVVGRRLDFLLQELNREANTLGSKSVDSIITHAAIEMKVLIEQIREQVQNVE